MNLLLTALLSPGNQAVLLGCGAAFFWGGGDFFGGLGVRAAGGSMRASVKLILLSHTVSLLLVFGLAMAMHIAYPTHHEMVWGISCGVAAALGLMCFYVALAEGSMGPSAAISGLLAAAIPSAAGMLTQGAPTLMQGAGFLAAAAAIWLIAAGEHLELVSRRTLVLSFLSGISFGIYFIGLKMANGAGPLWAMTLARCGSVSTAAVILIALISLGRKTGAPEQSFGKKAIQFAMGTVLLDTTGNMMFVVATRLGRLDVASVLASLYPASTIVLAAWFLHERPTPRQRWGMAVAVAAVVMITL